MPDLNWPDARNHLLATLQGLEAEATEGAVTETLTMYEWPPDSGSAKMPFGLIVPPPRNVTRHAGKVRNVEFDGGVSVAIALSPSQGDAARLTKLSQRYESWLETLMTVFDTKLSWGGTISVMNGQRFGELEQIPLTAFRYIGFVMTLDIRLKQTKTLGA